MKVHNPYTPLPCLNPSPYGEHLKEPVPATAVMDPYYYSVPDVKQPDDGVRLVRRLYHLDERLIGVIALGRGSSSDLTDQQLHSAVFGMAYGGVSGTKAERLTLALELCKRLRTHLGFDQVQTFIQTPNPATAGKTPLDVLAEWPSRKARRALEPVMIAHLL